MLKEPELSLSVTSIDLEVLEPRLKELVSHYRNALRFVARLPRIGRHRTRIFRVRGEKKRKAGPLPSRNRMVRLRLHILRFLSGRRIGRRWVVRQFVSLFVEAHIRTRLERIIKILSIEGISLNDDSDEQTKKIAFYVKRLKEIRESLIDWGRLYGLLTKAPLVSMFLPLAIAIVLRLWGIDFSGTKGLLESAAKLGAWLFLLTLLKLVAGVGLYLYMFFSAAMVGFGFRCKRAIFAGGEIPKDPFERDHLVAEIEKWDRVPETNIYQAENSLFHALRIQKPKEFPLDLVATFVPYYSLIVAVLFAVQLVLNLKHGAGLSISTVFPVALFGFLAAKFFVSGWLQYRDRAKSGNL